MTIANRPRGETSISTYGTRLRARKDPQHPCNKSFGFKPPNLPEEYRDRIAEKEFQAKLTGGYNTKRSNRCEMCFTTKSANGTCNCE